MNPRRPHTTQTTHNNHTYLHGRRLADLARVGGDEAGEARRLALERVGKQHLVLAQHLPLQPRLVGLQRLQALVVQVEEVRALASAHVDGVPGGWEVVLVQRAVAQHELAQLVADLVRVDLVALLHVEADVGQALHSVRNLEGG